MFFFVVLLIVSFHNANVIFILFKMFEVKGQITNKIFPFKFKACLNLYQKKFIMLLLYL